MADLPEGDDRPPARDCPNCHHSSRQHDLHSCSFVMPDGKKCPCEWTSGGIKLFLQMQDFYAKDGGDQT